MAVTPWALACLTLVVLAAGGNAATPGKPIPAHSHWDDTNAQYEITGCYQILRRTTGGAKVAYLPVREQDAKNYYEVQIRTDGFLATKRVGGVTQPLTQNYRAPMSYGVGSDVMFDLVLDDATITVYELEPDGSRGPLLGQWTDESASPYPQGVNVSYYTQPGWAGEWEDLHAVPLDAVGVAHDIGTNGYPLVQDATSETSVCGTDSVFDAVTPAAGGVTATTRPGAKTYGLPSGPDYRYTITAEGITQPGSYFDFRGPESSDHRFWGLGFYRLRLGTVTSPPTLTRFPATWVADCASAGTPQGDLVAAGEDLGGDGTYTLTLTATTITLSSGAIQLLRYTEPDGDPSSGSRVRLDSSDGETWTWSGTPLPPGELRLYGRLVVPASVPKRDVTRKRRYTRTLRSLSGVTGRLS
jgi:hypothetical protein